MTCRITDKNGLDVSGYFECNICGGTRAYRYSGKSFGKKVDVNKDRYEFIGECVAEIKKEGWVIYKNKDTNEWNHRCPDCAHFKY